MLTPWYPPTMTMPPSSPLRLTSLSFALASTMAASLQLPSRLAMQPLLALMVMLSPLVLASYLTLTVLTLLATHTPTGQLRQ